MLKLVVGLGLARPLAVGLARLVLRSAGLMPLIDPPALPPAPHLPALSPVLPPPLLCLVFPDSQSQNRNWFTPLSPAGSGGSNDGGGLCEKLDAQGAQGVAPPAACRLRSHLSPLPHSLLLPGHEPVADALSPSLSPAPPSAPVRRRRSLLSYPGARLFHPLHVPAPAGPTGQEPPPPTCPPAGRSAPAFQPERAAFRHIRVDL